jgi:hypothetical protein
MEHLTILPQCICHIVSYGPLIVLHHSQDIVQRSVTIKGVCVRLTIREPKSCVHSTHGWIRRTVLVNCTAVIAYVETFIPHLE